MCDLRPKVLLVQLGLVRVEASVVVNPLGVGRSGMQRCVNGTALVN